MENRPPVHPHTHTPPGSGMKPGDEAPPGTPGTGEALCPECSGSGRRGNDECANCNGTGTINVGVGGA